MTNRNKNQSRHLRVNKANQVDEKKIVNSNVPPSFWRHERLVSKDETKVIVELIEAEADANSNDCYEDVCEVPAETVKQVHPLRNYN